MSKRINTAIQAAIDNYEYARARQLLKENNHDADAETYYLASLVVTQEVQKIKYLEKALSEDSSHSKARKALKELKRSTTSYPAVQKKPEPEPRSLIRDTATTRTATTTRDTSTNPYWNASESFMQPREVSVTQEKGKKKKRQVRSESLAGFGSRFVALIIDGLILGVIFLIVGFIYGAAFPPPFAINYGDMVAYQHDMNNWLLKTNLLQLGIDILFNVYFLTMNEGQTPGKSAMGIQIVKLNDKQIGILDAIIRNEIGYTISAVFLFLGFLWPLFDGQNQAWHDKLVGTVVVKTRY